MAGVPEKNEKSQRRTAADFVKKESFRGF